MGYLAYSGHGAGLGRYTVAPGTDFLPKGTDDMAGGVRHGSKIWKLQLPYRTSQSKMSGLESESQELKGRAAGGLRGAGKPRNFR